MTPTNGTSRHEKQNAWNGKSTNGINRGLNTAEDYDWWIGRYDDRNSLQCEVEKKD